MGQSSPIGRDTPAPARLVSMAEMACAGETHHQPKLIHRRDHFVIPHRGLRQRLQPAQPTNGSKGSRKKWKPVTPAMAAGLTDHVWTMDELLSFRIPPSPRA